MIICNDVQWFEESVLIWNILMENMKRSALKALLSLNIFFIQKLYIYMCVCVCMFVPLCVAHICECEQDSDKFLTMAHIYSAE